MTTTPNYGVPEVSENVLDASRGMHRGSRMAWVSVAVGLALTAACAVPRDHPVDQGTLRGGLDAESSVQLDSLVRDVCGKSVVMLGEEPHHGGGHTLEIKSELVQRLIERCGFNAIYFESGVYEFADLDRRLAAGTSAPKQVADAIGGLWSVSSVIDPLVGYLYAQASAGRIRLAGLDPQLGSATSGYEKTALVDDLTQGLNEPRRSACAEVISRRTNGHYDAEHPDDAAERDRLVECDWRASRSLHWAEPTAAATPPRLRRERNPWKRGCWPVEPSRCGTSLRRLSLSSAWSMRCCSTTTRLVAQTGPCCSTEPSCCTRRSP